MKNEEFSQLELFTPNNSDSQQERFSINNFFTFLHGYEKILILSIALIVVGVLAFILGVEKGKGLVAVDHKERVLLSVPLKPQNIQAKPPQVNQNNSANTIPVTAAVVKGNYTIQIASYKNKASAIKEAEGLKSKGLEPILLTKGSFNVLCVGNFPDQGSAKITLSEIKKKYRDSIIRRL